MEFLGVGPMELLLILILALIIMGPNDMVKAGRTIGRTMRRVVKSPMWAAILQTSRGIKTLPNRLMREAGLEEDIQVLKATQEELRRQVEEVQRIRSPFKASVAEVNREVGTIGAQVNDEARAMTADLSLSAWTSPPETDAPAPSPGGAQPNAFDAWITPAGLGDDPDSTPPQAADPAEPTQPGSPSDS